MHPSLMPSFFAPPMPFQPEELFRHVVQLERVYVGLDSGDSNARMAVAKAIVASVAHFVEGSLKDQIRFHLRDLGTPEPVVALVEKQQRGLEDQKDLVKVLVLLREGAPISASIKELQALRNKIAHGAVVEATQLHLDDIGHFRQLAIGYLKEVYTGLKQPHPGWWS
jgi:hypothetical protein